MKTILTTLVASILMIGTVQAVDFPIRDVENGCHKRSLQVVPEVSQRVKNECIESEQRAYDSAKSSWWMLNDEEQQKCILSAGGHDGSFYGILEALMNQPIVQAERAGRYKALERKQTFRY
jgi:hypothetical protein